MHMTVGVNSRGLRVGQYHQRARLSDADVRSMLELRAQGWGWRRLASIFECSRRHVRDICAGIKRQQEPEAFRSVPLRAPLPDGQFNCARCGAMFKAVVVRPVNKGRGRLGVVGGGCPCQTVRLPATACAE